MMANWFAAGRLAKGLLVLLSLYAPLSKAQTNGFVNIDCGAEAEYTDSSGISWISDAQFITTGQISHNVSSQLYGASMKHSSLRYFPGLQSKFCYTLNATINTSYIVRSTFLHGKYDGRVRLPTFYLQIDTVDVGLILPNSSDTTVVMEVIATAVSDNIYLCLAPRQVGIDVPFINFIEMRPLGPRMYSKTRQGYMMISNYRYNFGGGNVSFPLDKYDRTWYGISALNGRSLNSTQNVIMSDNYSRDEAPPEVLNTANVWQKDLNFTIPLNAGEGMNYVVLLWFAEIEQGNQIREFEVGIDGNWQEPINVYSTVGRMYEAYQWGYPSVNLTSTSYLGLRSTARSQLGPILNGLEVYSVSDPVLPRTDVRDVAAIEAVKKHWNLSTWSGDPCLSAPYSWITCSLNIIPRIVELNLTRFNLIGSIPDVLGNLTELTSLSLEDNALTEPIPDLSALTKLQKLHLQENSLTGEFPAWVEKLPALEELFVEGNNLTGYVPPNLLNKRGLLFTYTPSPFLCSGTRTSCTPLASPMTASMTVSGGGGNGSSTLTIVIGCVVGGLAVTLLFFVAILIARCRKRKLLTKGLFFSKEAGDSVHIPKGQTKAYSFIEIKEATNDFKDQIREGDLGPVYKGRLPDGVEVAVKRCWPMPKRGAVEFFNEVVVSARVNHRNLTSLVGYCREGQEQVLLYEYYFNSELGTYIHGNGKSLSWTARLAIALDVAQGLQYLHSSCIIHGAVKPANILLTSKRVAKVAHFGFANFSCERDVTLQLHSVDAKGTDGYLDPELRENNHLTEKSDVYGFGVVLLELISGQAPINMAVLDRDPSLIKWMRPLLAAEDLKAVVDPALKDDYKLEAMWKMVELGMMCVEPRDFNRPSMTEVVQDIRDVIVIEEMTTVTTR